VGTKDKSAAIIAVDGA